MTFAEKLAWARKWEKAAAEWLRTRGWYTLPTYDYSAGGDKAPKLMSPTGAEDLVIPDLLTMRREGRRWLEVKYKSHADVHRNTEALWKIRGAAPEVARERSEVTGISLRLWGHYKAVQEATGIPVYVAFLHEKEREVRGGTLAELEAAVSHFYDGARMGRDGMIFFKYRALRVWTGVWAWVAARVDR